MHTQQSNQRGLALIEWMIVVVILGILAALAIPRFLPPSAQAKMAEAKQILKQVYVMEQAYLQEYDEYWAGVDERWSEPAHEYSVIADAENDRKFSRIGVAIPATGRYTYTLTARDQHFSCRATANLDKDPTMDIWSISQTGELIHETDDSADWPNHTKFILETAAFAAVFIVKMAISF